MWILDLYLNGGGDRPTARYFLTAATYCLGRKDGCDIMLDGSQTGRGSGTSPIRMRSEMNASRSASEDHSISRVHATMRVLASNVLRCSTSTNSSSGIDGNGASLQIPPPELFISDHSKHGTFVNNLRIASHEEHRLLRPGDSIRFGSRARGVVSYAPLIATVSPMLSSFRRREVELAVGRMGGVVLPSPKSRGELYSASIAVLALFHCCDGVESDSQTLHALLHGYTLVSPDYLCMLSDVLKGSPALEMERWPLPPTHSQEGRTSASAPPSSFRRPDWLADRTYFQPKPTFFSCPDGFLSQPAPPPPAHLLRTMRFLCVEPSLSSLSPSRLSMQQAYESFVVSAGGRWVTLSADRVMKAEGGVDLSTTGRRRRSADSRRHGGDNSVLLPLREWVQQVDEAHEFGAVAICSSQQHRSLMHALSSGGTAVRDQLRSMLSAHRGGGHQQHHQHTEVVVDGVPLNATTAALFRMWEQGVTVADEGCLVAAAFTHDGAACFAPASPGVLNRAVMTDLVLSDDDADSNATEDGLLPFDGLRSATPSISSLGPKATKEDPVVVTGGVTCCAPLQLPSGSARHCSTVPGIVSVSKATAPTATSSAIPQRDEAASYSHPIQQGWRKIQAVLHSDAGTVAGGQQAVAVAGGRRGRTTTSPEPPQRLGRPAVSPTRVATSPQPRTVSPQRTMFSRSGQTASHRIPSRRADESLYQLCSTFLLQVIPALTRDVDHACTSILQQQFVDNASQAVLDSVEATSHSFLEALAASESATSVGDVLSSETRRVAHACREAIDAMQRAVRASYRHVGIHAPRMTSPKRQQSPTRRVLRISSSPTRS